MSKLTVLKDGAVYREIELSSGDLRLGRVGENDVVLEDPEKAVSRFHAELRYEGGRYVIIDLNSQNGTWIRGQRVQRAELETDVPVAIGPYQLVLKAGAAPAVEARPATTAAPARPRDDTMVGVARREAGPAAARPATAPAAARAPKTRPVKPGQTGPRPGLVAAIARLPKPVIFGGFAVIVITIMGLAQLLAPTSEPVPGPSSAPAGQPAPEPPKETNEQIIGRLINESKAALESGDVDGAISRLEQALIINPDHQETLDLKIKAEEQRRLQTQAGPPVAAGPAAGAPAPAAHPPAATGAQAGEVTPGGAARPAPTPPVPPARTARPALVPDPAMAARRPGERESAWRARSQSLQRRYADANRALGRGDLAAAVAGFEGIARDDPGYRDVASLLGRAREQARAHAQQALDAGLELEQSGDLPGAARQLERAAQVDATLTPAADALRRVRARMRAEGEDAFKRARQYDALGRAVDAIPLYERALLLLPPEHESRKVAKERLDALRAGVR